MTLGGGESSAQAGPGRHRLSASTSLEGRGLTDLVEARVATHYAAQLVAAVGRSLLPSRPGFRHAALFWDDVLRRLAGAPVPCEGGATIRAVLHFDPPAVAMVGGPAPRSDPGAAALPLAGATMDSALAWLRAQLAAAGVSADRLVVRPPRDMPAHPLAGGADFAIPAGASRELGGWFGLASGLLTEQASRHEAELPVPCWSHHFDLAVVVPLDRGPVPGPDAPQITLGFSPGDGGIPQPYFYVLPWPAPAGRSPHTIPVGAHWQTDGWTGLTMTATALLAMPDTEVAGRSFLDRGFVSVRDMLLKG